MPDESPEPSATGNARRGRGPGRLGAGLTIDGDIISGEDLVLEGRLNGGLHAPENAVTIAASASVRGRLFARIVSIEGAVSGEVIATGSIEVAAGAKVEADLTAPVVAVEEGAWVTGRIDMRRAEAAARVARYRADRATEAAAPPARTGTAPARP